MVAWLPDGLSRAAIVSLDHDLGATREQDDGTRFDPGTGRDVVNALAALPPGCPVIVHSSNGTAAQGMVLELEGKGWLAIRVYPMNDLEWIAAQWIEQVSRAV